MDNMYSGIIIFIINYIMGTLQFKEDKAFLNNPL